MQQISLDLNHELLFVFDADSRFTLIFLKSLLLFLDEVHLEKVVFLQLGEVIDHIFLINAYILIAVTVIRVEIDLRVLHFLVGFRLKIVDVCSGRLLVDLIIRCNSRGLPCDRNFVDFNARFLRLWLPLKGHCGHKC